ncbi:hypothetical protein COBT_003395, partial [Conglomerata obtusa]
MNYQISSQKKKSFHDALTNNYKFIIVNGPSGSGKTTAITQLCKAYSIQLEYISDIRKFKKFISKKTVGLVDLDDKKSITDVLLQLYSNKIIIETRCSITKKEIENNIAERCKGKHEISQLGNDFFIHQERYKNTKKNILGKSHLDIIDSNTAYYINNNEISSKSNQLIHKINGQQKYKLSHKQNYSIRDENFFKNESNGIINHSSYYDDLFISESETLSHTPCSNNTSTKCNTQDNKNNEKDFILIQFTKVSDSKIKKITDKYKHVDGNLHKLQFVNLITEEYSNIGFYHLIGKILYSKTNDTRRKKDVLNRYKIYDKYRIIDYLRENAMGFLSFKDISIFCTLLS